MGVVQSLTRAKQGPILSEHSLIIQKKRLASPPNGIKTMHRSQLDSIPRRCGETRVIARRDCMPGVYVIDCIRPASHVTNFECEILEADRRLVVRTEQHHLQGLWMGSVLGRFTTHHRHVRHENPPRQPPHPSKRSNRNPIRLTSTVDPSCPMTATGSGIPAVRIAITMIAIAPKAIVKLT